MNNDLENKWWSNAKFCYEESRSMTNYYLVNVYVAFSNNKLYLNGFVGQSFQPNAIYFPFIFKHSKSKEMCRIGIKKNYV